MIATTHPDANGPFISRRRALSRRRFLRAAGVGVAVVLVVLLRQLVVVSPRRNAALGMSFPSCFATARSEFGAASFTGGGNLGGEQVLRKLRGREHA